MNHLIACPECNKSLQVPEELIGKSVQCPECKHAFAAVLPEAPALPPPTPKKTSTRPAWDQKKTNAGAAKTTRKRRDDEDDDYDGRDDDDDVDRRRSRRGRGGDVPGKVTGIAVMALIGGIVAVILFLAIIGSSGGLCCLWPGTYYSIIVGIMAIVKGASLLGASAHRQTPPTAIGVMLIINIINLDVVNVVLGIMILVFCGDEEVTNYMAP